MRGERLIYCENICISSNNSSLVPICSSLMNECGSARDISLTVFFVCVVVLCVD